MTKKATYEELEQRVKELENEVCEHKQTKEALRESEEQFGAVAGVGSTGLDRMGTIDQLRTALHDAIARE